MTWFKKIITIVQPLNYDAVLNQALSHFRQSLTIYIFQRHKMSVFRKNGAFIYEKIIL